MKRQNNKPVIGVVSKNITIEEFYNWSWQRISNDIRYSINKNGGLVLGILPQTSEDLLYFVNKCDGIILQGGISSHNYEEYIAKYCYDNDIPLLGICAGYNNIIRGLGGLATRIDNVEVHDRPDLTYAHECIVIDKESLLYSIVKEDKFMVNSVHTYVGSKIPSQLSVVAISSDNQIEVIEAKNKEFYMGIKYHPELLVDIDKKQDNIFKDFLDACKQ